MAQLLEDLKYALRQFGRSPGFVLFIVATLGIGIGANTTIFGAVNAFLLRALPYADSERLITLSGAYKNRGDEWSVSLPNAVDWGKRNRSLESVGYYQGGNVTLAGGDQPERIETLNSSASLMSLLGARPILGRSFTAEENSPQGDRVAVLSYGLWQRRFGGQRDVLGKIVTLSGNPYTIIGVYPASFSFPYDGTELYLPLRANETTWNRANGGLQVVGKLKPGVTMAAAQRDLDAVSVTLSKDYPDVNFEFSSKLRTLRERLRGGEDLPLVMYTLLAAVGFVLLIACVNVANLLLARATGREREVAVRTAIGATRYRVVRQLLTESLLLATLGGITGCLFSLWGTRLLVAAIPTDLELPRNLGIDGNVLLFTAAVTLLTGVIFGLAPAVQVTRPDLSVLMGARTGQQTRRRARARSTLVVAQVSLASVLLVSAGLMIRSLTALIGTNPGFQAENVLTMRVSLDATYDSKEKSQAFQHQVLDRLRALPGVSVAGAVDWLPLAGTNNYNDFRLEGAPADKRENAGTVIVTPGYLEAMNIQLLRGRAIDSRDVREAPGIVLVNVAFAEKYYAKENPIGKRLLIGIDGGGKTPYYRTIVGVVGNVLHSGLDEEQRTEMYVPYDQLFWNMNTMAFVLRTRGEPDALLKAAQNALTGVDRNQAAYDARTMERLIEENSSVVVARLIAGALAIFGALALLLAALGLYGVISYGVAQRTYEIGVRGALGATRGDVIKLILGQGMGLVGIGLTIGLFGAVGLTRLMTSMLHGVSALDPVTFVQAAALLTGVAVLATVLPARRASRIDPSIALRSE